MINNQNSISINNTVKAYRKFLDAVEAGMIDVITNDKDWSSAVHNNQKYRLFDWIAKKVDEIAPAIEALEVLAKENTEKDSNDRL